MAQPQEFKSSNRCAGRTRNYGRYRGHGRDWETPWELFNELNKEFAFTLDPCARPETAKVKKFYTERENGLGQNWQNEVVFLNPPYGDGLRLWIYKAVDAATNYNATVVALLPSATGSDWFHDYVLEEKAEIRFIQGRVKFRVGEKYAETFQPNMIVVWRPHGQR